MNKQLKKLHDNISEEKAYNNFFKEIKFRAFDIQAKKMIFDFCLTMANDNNETWWSASQFTNDSSYIWDINTLINDFFEKRGDIFNCGIYSLIDESDYRGILCYYIMQYTNICDNTKFNELSDEEKIKINEKNWKGYEIYEADIIQLNPNIKEYKYVIFKDGAYWLCDIDSENLILLNLIKTQYPEAKMVGNIFQNQNILNLFEK